MVVRAPASHVWLVATMGLFLVTGCSDGSGSSRPPGSASPEASASSDVTAEQVAVEAYRGMWDAFVEAARTSDASNPRLARYATGQALELITTSLSNDRSAGVVTKGTPVIKPRIVQPPTAGQSATVTISDCADATTWLKYKASTDDLADNTPGGQHDVRAVVQNVGGWKVVTFQVKGTGSC